MTREIEKAGLGALELYEREEFLSYLRSVRKELEENPEARDMVAESSPATEAREELLRILSSERIGREFPVLRPGGDGLLGRAVDQVLSELEVQRTGPRSMYLVDESTGEAVMALPKEFVYQPPDYVDENGVRRKARPMLHPGLSSSLAMKKAEANRAGKAVEKVRQNPSLAAAYEHVIRPDRMRELAASRLAELGVSVLELRDEDAPGTSVLEFGHEHVSGSDGSVNPMFHRSRLFSEQLARAVLREFPGLGSVRMGRVVPADNGKRRWYRVRAAPAESGGPADPG